MLDITDHLLEIEYGNKYVSVAIDHYSKWCEVKPVKEHTVIVVAILLEKEIICRFGVPKYVLVDNCGQWMVKFDMLCINLLLPNGHNVIEWQKG